MKVLFVQKEGGIFGAENYHLNIIPGLVAKGITIEFLRLYTSHQGGVGGDFINRLNGMGIKTYEVNIRRFPSLNTLFKIRRIVNKGSYDVVHTHLIHADLYLALIKTFMSLKSVLVSTKHGYDNNFTAQYGFNASKQTLTAYYMISRWAEKRMNASFTISNGLRDFFIKIGLTNSERMQLIHYGFNMPPNYLNKGQDGFRVASKQIIIVGRLTLFKGHRFLIEAMKGVIQKFGDEVKLIIVGSGELEDELKAQVNGLNLSDYIDFIGFSNEVGHWMANSDIVVVPSVSEGFGVVFLEAFSAKTPVVAWNVSAGNELMEHQKTGYLVPAYDTDQLAEQLIDILNHPKSQSTIVEAAYQQLKGYYNLERMVNEIISFYNDVLHR